VTHEIRTFGDPVLRTVAAEVTEVDGAVAALAERMLGVMYAAPGLGLAATQIGVQRQVFVYDVAAAVGDDEDARDPRVLLNPRIVESRGEWCYDEGCLSIPGISVEILRPREVLVRGVDLRGDEVEIEADDLLARLFQHEVDHLQGVLMFERMTPAQRTEALAAWRRREELGGRAEPAHVRIG
jgi:peptide deformylase